MDYLEPRKETPAKQPVSPIQIGSRYSNQIDIRWDRVSDKKSIVSDGGKVITKKASGYDTVYSNYEIDPNTACIYVWEVEITIKHSSMYFGIDSSNWNGCFI